MVSIVRLSALRPVPPPKPLPALTLALTGTRPRPDPRPNPPLSGRPLTLAHPAPQKASSAFRDAKTAVLIASDVAARGVDYPDVSLVVQLGAPDNREQYVHRTGRTGRAGKVRLMPG